MNKDMASYSDRQIEEARRHLKRRYKVDATEYEAIWLLRDQHEPGWRARKDRPADKLVYCLNEAFPPAPDPEEARAENVTPPASSGGTETR